MCSTKKSIIKLTGSESAKQATKHVTFNETKQVLCEKKNGVKVVFEKKWQRPTTAPVRVTHTKDKIEIKDIDDQTVDKPSDKAPIVSKIKIESTFVPKKKFVYESPVKMRPKSKSPISDFRFIKSNSLILASQIEKEKSSDASKLVSVKSFELDTGIRTGRSGKASKNTSLLNLTQSDSLSSTEVPSNSSSTSSGNVGNNRTSWSSIVITNR
jgi:hypothetical protein